MVLEKKGGKPPKNDLFFFQITNKNSNINEFQNIMVKSIS